MEENKTTNNNPEQQEKITEESFYKTIPTQKVPNTSSPDETSSFFRSNLKWIIVTIIAVWLIVAAVASLLNATPKSDPGAEAPMRAAVAKIDLGGFVKHKDVFKPGGKGCCDVRTLEQSYIAVPIVSDSYDNRKLLAEKLAGKMTAAGFKEVESGCSSVNEHDSQPSCYAKAKSGKFYFHWKVYDWDTKEITLSIL